MFKNIIVVLLIICFLANFQSCCTMIGHSIGKRMDEKNEKSMQFSIKDSSDIALVTNKIDSTDVRQTHYKTMFAAVGLLADISFTIIVMLLINPIQINLRGGF